MSTNKLVQKLINALQGNEEYEVLENLDNTEVRGANAVSVGVDETTQMNVGLPDYKHSVSIYVSSHITEDTSASIFKSICAEVRARLDRYVLNEAPLAELFEEVPVVGFFFEREKMMVVDDTYGKCYLAHLEYSIITSYN